MEPERTSTPHKSEAFREAITPHSIRLQPQWTNHPLAHSKVLQQVTRFLQGRLLPNNEAEIFLSNLCFQANRGRHTENTEIRNPAEPIVRTTRSDFTTIGRHTSVSTKRSAGVEASAHAGWPGVLSKGARAKSSRCNKTRQDIPQDAPSVRDRALHCQSGYAKTGGCCSATNETRQTAQPIPRAHNFDLNKNLRPAETTEYSEC